MIFMPGVGLITKLPYGPPFAMQAVPACASPDVHAGAVNPAGTKAGRVLVWLFPYWSIPCVMLKGGAEL